jgi:hypothetical protein
LGDNEEFFNEASKDIAHFAESYNPDKVLSPDKVLRELKYMP